MTTVDEAIEVLNRIYREDSFAIESLIDYRIKCNNQLADDPTVQVTTETWFHNDVDYSYTTVGLLGIINGIFGTTYPGGPGYICAIWDDNGNFIGFGKTDGKGNELTDGGKTIQ